jgi:SET domain-containing protein
MKKQLFVNKIIVKKSSTHGYGVFAAKAFKKGEIIEECYIIISRGGDRKLEDYYFDVNGKYGLFTGFGIIYNHSDNPNADYHINAKRKLTTFKANRAIKKGEEIFISYGEEWFSSRNMKEKKPRED